MKVGDWVPGTSGVSVFSCTLGMLRAISTPSWSPGGSDVWENVERCMSRPGGRKRGRSWWELRLAFGATRVWGSQRLNARVLLHA